MCSFYLLETAHAMSVSCETYYSEQIPTKRNIDEEKSTTIAFDLDKNEVLSGNSTNVESDLLKLKIQGYAIVFNMKFDGSDIYEVGIAKINLNKNGYSIIDKNSFYAAHSLTRNLWVGVRVDSENFLEAKCFE